MNSPSSTDTAEHGGDSSHHPGGHWFQNQVSSTDPRSVASGYQLLLQRFLDHPRLQAHARLPQVWLLPDHVSHWRPAAGGGSWAWWSVHGWEKERVVGIWSTASLTSPASWDKRPSPSSSPGYIVVVFLFFCFLKICLLNPETPPQPSSDFFSFPTCWFRFFLNLCFFCCCFFNFLFSWRQW